MKIHALKSKIHRVKVTGADLNYIGSITIEEAKAYKPALIFPNEENNLLN